MKATPVASAPVASAPAPEPRINIKFIVYYRHGVKLCYDKLFTIRKTDNNFLLQYKDEILTYAIPLYKDNKQVITIIKNIINERSFKYKCWLYINDVRKNKKKFLNLNGLINHIILISSNFVNVEYSNL